MKKKVSISQLASSSIYKLETVEQFIESLKNIDKNVVKIESTLYLELSSAYLHAIYRSARNLESSLQVELTVVSIKNTFNFLKNKYFNKDYDEFLELAVDRAKEYDEILDHGDPENVVLVLGTAIAAHIWGKKHKEHIELLSAIAIWYGNVCISLVKFLINLNEKCTIVLDENSTIQKANEGDRMLDKFKTIGRRTSKYLQNTLVGRSEIISTIDAIVKRYIKLKTELPVYDDNKIFYLILGEHLLPFITPPKNWVNNLELKNATEIKNIRTLILIILKYKIPLTKFSFFLTWVTNVIDDELTNKYNF
jgi:hypothetical protein